MGRRLLSMLAPHRRALLLAMLQLLATSALDLLKPWPLKLVLDTVIGNAAPPIVLRQWLPPWALQAETLLALSSAAIVGLAAAGGAVTLWYNHTAIGLGHRLVAELRERVHAHLLRLSLSYHTARSPADLTYHLTADSFAAQTWITNGLLPMLSALVLLAGIAAVLLQLDPMLGALSLAVVPALAVLLGLLNPRIEAIATTLRDQQSGLYTSIQGRFAAIRLIQAFSGEPPEDQRFRIDSQRSLQAGLRLYDWQTLYGTLVNVTVAAGTAVVVYVGARAVIGGRITPGELVVFVSYLATLYGPINQIAQSWGLIAGARVGLTRCFALLDETSRPVSGSQLLSAAQATLGLRFEDVSFRYRTEVPVLRGIDLTIEPGQRVAIVGATGAGKSTLLGLIPRFHDPDGGRVTIGGTDLRDFDLDSLRERIGMVLQPPLILPTSMAENIAYGRPKARRDEIAVAARACLLDGLIARLPQGLDTLIGDGGAPLSEGERQRVTIARALLRDPPILLLDEPTSALDSITEEAVLQAINILTAGRTSITIAHRLSTVRTADLIIVLADGEIAETGSFAELMNKDGFFTALVRALRTFLPENGGDCLAELRSDVPPAAFNGRHRRRAIAPPAGSRCRCPASTCNPCRRC